MFFLSPLLLIVLCICLCSRAVLSVETEAGSKDSLSAQLDAELSNLSTSALINILEQQGMDIGDNYFTREELVRLIKMSLDREYSSGDEPTKDQPSPESTPAQVKSVPVVFDDDAPVWERVKQQMRADIEPFLALIPGPVKSYVHKELVHLAKTVDVLLRGAVSPMIGVAVKLLNRTAQLVLNLADRLKEHNQALQEKQAAAYRNRKEVPGL